MKRKLTAVLSVFFLLFTLTGFAQSVTGNKDNTVTRNLHDIQQKFYSKYGDKSELKTEIDNPGEENEEDSYYNEFKRWEYLMRSRTFPSGILPEPGILFKEYDKFKAAHPEAFTTRSATWTPVGTDGVPGNGGGVGRVNVIRFDPSNSNTIYVGTAGGGVWKTTNGGTSWSDITSSIPVTSIADIAIDAINTNNIYIATGDGYGYEATWQADNDFWGGVYSAGVLKSTDGGTTWNATGLSYLQSNNEIIQRLLISPSNPSMLLAATRSGIYRTADGGVSWTVVDPDHCYDMEFNTADANIVYAGGNQDILKSTDAGATWTVLKNNLCGAGRISVETSASNSLVIYALCENGTLSKTIDGGVTWTTKSSPSGAAGFYGYYDMVLECSDANSEFLLAGGLNVAKSTNGGTSWQSASINSPYTASNYVHADNHELEFLPGTTTTYLSGNDGGIFKTTNSGSNWSNLSNGLRIAQTYRLSSSATDPSIVYSGWQDNGSNRWNGTTYTQVYGADGMESLVDYTNSNTVFIETQYGSIYKSTNGGSSFSYVAPSSGGWLTEYIMDPVDHNKMYAGYTSLYRSTNNGSGWSVIGSNLYGGDYATSIAVAPSNTSYIYTASLGVMKKSTNGGTSWSTITAGLPVGSVGINYIAVSNTNPDNVWVVLSGYSAGNKVFHSTDGGSSWTNISGTLPNLPVNTIVYENNSPNRVYIGTDIGVYYLDDNNSDWTFYNDGLPNVMVHELEINYTSLKLMAATYGKGIWQSDLVSGTPTLAISTSPLASSLLCIGKSVSVSFTTTGAFSNGNIFTAQLSDAAGNFASPVSIGTLNATTSGTISATIPASTVAGSAYRIRVIGSNPSITGTDNGTNLSISCPPPTSPTTTNITANSANLNWTPASCSSTYQVQYHPATTTTWTKVIVTGSTYISSGLVANTSYKWKVRTQCVNVPKVWSAFSATKTFTTSSTKFAEKNMIQADNISVYPNPLSSSAVISIDVANSTKAEVTLLNMEGNDVQQLYNGELEEGNHFFTLNRNQLSAGIYLLRMISTYGIITQKVVIE
jgi:photosystem II stability/assembly factor-like uncharacterized protein